MNGSTWGFAGGYAGYTEAVADPRPIQGTLTAIMLPEIVFRRTDYGWAACSDGTENASLSNK